MWQLTDAWVSSFGLEAEMAALNYQTKAGHLVQKRGGLPTGEDIFNALFAEEPIEWNRSSAFQDVSMRLISERVLRATAPENQQPVYLQGEVEKQRVKLRAPLHKFHLYCSSHNIGAVQLADELQVSMVTRRKLSGRLTRHRSHTGVPAAAAAAGGVPARSQGAQALI